MTRACTMCSGTAQLLGKLGRASAWRCVHCGWTFTTLPRRR